MIGQLPSLGAVGVGVLGGFAAGVPVASLIVASRPGPQDTEPAEVTAVPVISSIAGPATVTAVGRYLLRPG
jgi:hypothetical protein